MFSNTLSVGVAFAITGTFLWLTRRAGEGVHSESSMPWRMALIIGVVQGLAITPGISRSGSTIAAAMFLGIERQAAAKYSFLLSVPAILGAFVLKAGDLDLNPDSLAPLLTGFCTAAITGYVALRLLLAFVRQGNLDKFAYYLWPLAAASIGMTLAG
jgi:undecaprenyl-diphosphatase